MHVVVLPDHEAVSRCAAELLCGATAWKPSAQLGVATGTTPRRAYELAAERVQAGEASFARARLVQLVEWGGMAPDDPGSCQSYLRERVLGPLRIEPTRFAGLRGDAADLDAECGRMRAHLETTGGLDLVLLGLGLNGHVALNEPGEFLAPSAHIAELAETTRHKSQFEHADEVPEQGLTLGMAELLGAREVVLVVTGEAKAEGVRRLLEGEIATTFPASLLWAHQRAVCLVDKAAHALVRRHSLFR